MLLRASVLSHVIGGSFGMKYVIDDELVDWLRKLEPADNFQIMSLLHCKARRMLAAEIGQVHPDWNEEQVRQEVVRRLLEDDKLPDLHTRDLFEDRRLPESWNAWKAANVTSEGSLK
jgi:hypothetical protein